MMLIEYLYSLTINKMKFKKDEIMKVIYERKDIVIVVAIFLTVFTFLGVVAVNIMSVKMTERDVANYDELIRNPYEKYENIMSKTKINDLVNSAQFKEMKHSPDLIIKEDPEIKISPFEKKY